MEFQNIKILSIRYTMLAQKTPGRVTNGFFSLSIGFYLPHMEYEGSTYWFSVEKNENFYF
jgi:hypothetical protein